MKVAISIPDPMFDAAEQLALQLRVSRSRLYSQALAAYLCSRGAAAITAKLNALHAVEPSQVDRALALAQSRTLDHEAW